MVIVEELQFDFGIELRLQEGEKSDVASQCLDQSFSSPFALRIRPTLRHLRGRNIIGKQVVNKRRSMAVGADVPYSARTFAAWERYGQWERGDRLERG